jgi:site-specific DNA-methyltransferase (adenine-specific)
MEVIKVKIEEIIPYKNNAKLHPQEQIEQIKKSILEFGNNDPIAIDENNVIIEGNGRYKALTQLGYTEVDCIRLEHLTEEQKKAYILIHNQLTMNTGFDIEMLELELASIENIDMSEFDFEIDFDADDEPVEIVEDEVPDVDDAEPITKLGDIWQLGRHRLMCGDSTDKATVEKLMDGNKADMVMTDPPYGINAEKMTMGSGAKDFHRGEDWDSERPDISIVFDIAPLVCIWGGNYFADKLPITNDWLIWHKKNDGLSFSECEMAWTNFGINCRHISHHWGNEKKQHITMKPLSVIAWAIDRAKEKADTIVDLFGGSGTTLIACEQLNRTCYMMELDPKYCDVIIKRWETLTGEKAELISR